MVIRGAPVQRLNLATVAVTSINGLLGPITLDGGHAVNVTTNSGTNTITVAFDGGLDDLSDVDLSGVVTGDILLKGPGSWINYPLGTITAAFVPYTGASANVNLGTNSLTAATVLTDTVIAENLFFNSVPYDSLICTSVSSGQLTNVQMGNNLSFFEGELSVTNAALTRTNDTNVTLTLTGGAGSALLAAVNLALGWTGTLAAPRGGTGFGSYTVGDILYADTTTSLAKLADVATGNVLLSGGVGVAPSWGKVSASGAITGILPIANGGTNTNTQTSFGMCYYDGTKLTTSPYTTLSFIAGDVDFLITHPTVSGTAYEVLVTSSSCQYLMAYNTVSAFQGICGIAATENYWTLSTKGLGLSVSSSVLWFGSTSNDDVSFYRNTTERLRLMTTGVYVPDVLYLSAASPTINAMVTGTTLIQSSVRLVSAYAGAASANSHYFLGSGNDGGLLQLFGASGTIASPTAMTTDGRMGGVFGRGYAATGYSNAVTAISFHAESTFSDTSTPSYIAFATTASGATTRTERMRLASNGTLKVGTAIIGPWPASSTLALFGHSSLDHTSAANYSMVVTAAGELNLNRPTGQPIYFREANGATAQMTILSGGNTGINLNSPSAQFHVYKSIYETPSLTFGSDCATIIRGELAELAFGFGYPSYAGMYLQARYTSNVSLPLFLNPVGGDVLVGTSTSSGKLTVNLGGSGTSLSLLTGNSSNYNAFVMGRASADATIGIASTTGHFSASAVAGDCVIRAESSSKALILQAGAGASVVYVTSSSVGVATAAPASGYTLDVAGNVIMSNGYRNLSLLGGNSSGFLYGCYAKYGDGIHLGYNFYNNNTSNVIPNTGGSTSRLTLAYGAIACYVGAVNTEPTTLGWLVNGTGETTFGSGIAVPRTKPVQFDSSPTSLDNSIHMVNGAPYGLRISGANDAANNRNTQFGYYNAGTWQTRADINNYTGTIYAYSTISVQNTTPTAASYTCGNSGVGASSSYGNYRLLMYDSGAAADSYGIGINSYTLWYNSYQYHEWTARNVRTMLLDGSGLVIGNTGTYARAKLEVVGDIWTDWSDRFIGTVYQTGSAYKMGFATTTAVRALDLIAMSADNSAIRFWTGSTPSVNAYIDNLSNVVLGNQSALATNATNGFVYIRTCAGTPTGAPTAFTGHVAMLFDTTNSKLYCYNGAWKSVTLT